MVSWDGPGSSLSPSSGLKMSSAPPSMTAQVRVRFVLGLVCWRSTCWRPGEESLLLLPKASLDALKRKQALLLTLSPQKRRIHSRQGMASLQISLLVGMVRVAQERRQIATQVDMYCF